MCLRAETKELEGRAETWVVLPRLEGARGSGDAGEHGECQQCRDDELHDGVSLHNCVPTDARDNGRVL
jgi:hypothetical protein